MKKILVFLVLAIIVVAGCRKSDNSKLPDLARVPVPSLKIDATSDQIINPGAPASFKGKVIVDLFFKNDIPPRKFDVVIMKNNNTAITKVYKADVTSFPVTLDITGQQLIDLFGAPIADGDLFTVGVDITTQNGTVYQAFPAVGAAYGTGIQNVAGGVNTTVQFLKPCTFVSSAYAGDFTVVSDEWQDYAAGAVIPVKVINATQISFEYNTDAGTAKPIILTINPSNNAITVAKQVYGNYGAAVLSAESVAGTASVINPCDLSLSIRLNHTSGADNYGAATLKLKKKQ